MLNKLLLLVTLADTKVTAVRPDKWIRELKTDKSGRVEVPFKDKGRYILIGAHGADAVGDVEIAGEKIAELNYTSTLSFVAP